MKLKPIKSKKAFGRLKSRRRLTCYNKMNRYKPSDRMDNFVTGFNVGWKECYEALRKRGMLKLDLGDVE